MNEQGKPMTKIVKASEARQQWSELLNIVYQGKTRVIVEKSGIPVAAVVSSQDLNRLKQLDEEQAEALRTLARLREPFKDISPEEIEAEVAKSLTAVRREMRADQKQGVAHC